jgi:hypothetical protein
LRASIGVPAEDAGGHSGEYGRSSYFFAAGASRFSSSVQFKTTSIRFGAVLPESTGASIRKR